MIAVTAALSRGFVFQMFLFGIGGKYSKGEKYLIEGLQLF